MRIKSGSGTTLCFCICTTIVGCATPSSNSSASPSDASGSSREIAASPSQRQRSVLLLLEGGKGDSPGAGWTFNGTNGWERFVTVTEDVKKVEQGSKHTIQIAQIASLPSGVWVGPVSARSMIGRGVEIGNMGTSKGPMIMLKIDPARNTVEWVE